VGFGVGDLVSRHGDDESCVHVTSFFGVGRREGGPFSLSLYMCVCMCVCVCLDLKNFLFRKKLQFFYLD